MPDLHDILFKSLADPTRRAIFERLCRDGEQTVGALTARAGVSQPAVSKHLGVLKQAGLVLDRHEGRQTHYSAQLGALAPLIDWTSQMAGFWQSRFDQLEDQLNLVFDDSAKHVSIQCKANPSKHSQLSYAGGALEHAANTLNDSFVAGH